MGTPHYFAPEVIQAGRADSASRVSYGKEVDMWSMGVMLYIILSAVPPFDDDSGDMYSRICGGEWEFDVDEFHKVSPESKLLVRSLLKVKPDERLTVEQACDHPWFSLEIPSGMAVDGVKPRPAEEGPTNSGEPVVKRIKTGEAA